MRQRVAHQKIQTFYFFFFFFKKCNYSFLHVDVAFFVKFFSRFTSLAKPEVVSKFRQNWSTANVKTIRAHLGKMSKKSFQSFFELFVILTNGLFREALNKKSDGVLIGRDCEAI